MFPIRDENPAHRTPFVTLSLIVANVVVFVLEVMGQMAPGGTEMGINPFVQNFALVPEALMLGGQVGAYPAWLTLFTSMFLHGGIGHLLGNMWFLWIFGDNIECFLGHAKYLIFYLVCGVLASLTHVAIDPSSAIPTLGASGAISGVLGGYILLYPRIRIQTLYVFGFIQMMRVPAVTFLGIWFVMQLLGGMGSDTGVAFGAHIGGFVAGVAIMFCLTRRTPGGAEHTYDPRRIRRR